jgi:hypothetical protein
MIEVRIIDKKPNDILDLVKEIKALGHIQGKDFDFEYYPPKYDALSTEAVYNRVTVFKFYTEQLATWFSLRYQ